MKYNQQEFANFVLSLSLAEGTEFVDFAKSLGKLTGKWVTWEGAQEPHIETSARLFEYWCTYAKDIRHTGGAWIEIIHEAMHTWKART